LADGPKKSLDESLLNALANTGIAWRIYPLKSPAQVVPRGTGRWAAKRSSCRSFGSFENFRQQPIDPADLAAGDICVPRGTRREIFACPRTFHVERPVRPPGDGVAVSVDPRTLQTAIIDVACLADGCSTWNTRHEIPRTCPPPAVPRGTSAEVGR
jgi:hypothetical protein